MEVRGRSRKNRRRADVRRQIRAWVSMVLTAAMIIGNMAASVNTVLAATPARKEEFRLRAKDIQKAAEKALAEGNAVAEEILLDGNDKNVVKEYQEMLEADGRLYELDILNNLETVKDVSGITLRVFMRLPEETDPKTHVLNGEEELYFLYVNDGSESVTARLNIEGLLSGFSTVRPYEAVFGGNEINVEGQGQEEESDESKAEESGEGLIESGGESTEAAETGETQESSKAEVHSSGETESTEGNVQESTAGKNEIGEEKKEDSGNAEDASTGSEVKADEVKDSEDKTENKDNTETDTKLETDSKEEIDTKVENDIKTENDIKAEDNTKAESDAKTEDNTKTENNTKIEDNVKTEDNIKTEDNAKTESESKAESGSKSEGNVDTEKGSGEQSKDSSSSEQTSSDKADSAEKGDSAGKSETSDTGNISASGNHTDNHSSTAGSGKDSSDSTENTSSGTEDKGSSSSKTDSSDKGSSSDKADSSDKGSTGSSSDKSDSSDKGSAGSSSDKSDSSEKKSAGSSSDKSDSSDKGSTGSSSDKGSSDKGGSSEGKSSSENKSDSGNKDSGKETAYNHLGISLKQILRVAEPDGLVEDEGKSTSEETEAAKEEAEDTSAEEDIKESEEEETSEEETNKEDETSEEDEASREEEINSEDETNKEEEISSEETSEAEETAEIAEPETEEAETKPETEAAEEEGSAAEETSEVVVEITEEDKDKSEAAAEAVSSTESNHAEETLEAVNDEDADSDYSEDDKDFAENEEGEDTATTVKEEEKDPFEKKGVLEGKMYNLVAFENGLTARAFVTTLEKLGMNKEDLIEGGHILTYTVSPVGSAVVINAPELVRDESEVTFGVIPQVGYQVSEVLANGENLEHVIRTELASDSDAKKVSINDSNEKKDVEYDEDAVVYFTIPKVLESCEIEIVMMEEVEDSHPAFYEAITINGVTVSVSAEEGILPEGTYLTVEEVTDKVSEAVKENDEEAETIIAYDINLMLDGKKLSNNYWKGNYVNVEFSGKRIEEIKENAERIEIAPVEMPTKTVEAALGDSEKVPLLEEVKAENIHINEDEVTVIQDNKGDSIQIKAEHFTVYIVKIFAGSHLDTLNSATVNLYRRENDGAIRIGDADYKQYNTVSAEFKNEAYAVDGFRTYEVPINDVSLLNTNDTIKSVYYSADGTSMQQVTGFFVETSIDTENIKTVKISANLNNETTVIFSSLSFYNNDSTHGWTITKTEDYSSNFYWIADLNKVEWYVNGVCTKTTYVKSGATPSYGGVPTRGTLICNSGCNQKITPEFSGWAQEANSKDYCKKDSPLPAVYEDTKYYAIFTYDALFYVLLPGKDAEKNTTAADYMFAGPDGQDNGNKIFGKVIVPDQFDRRWYVGVQLKDIDSLIVVDTNNESVKTGLKKIYNGQNGKEQYQDSWKFKADWVTLTVACQSVDYDYKVIHNPVILHVDGMITLDKDTEVDIGYVVAYPDREKTNMRSVTHQKGEEFEFELNSTVAQTGSFTTDGGVYNATYLATDGYTYTFDGWYLDSNYTVKAPEKWIPQSPVTFYARYSVKDQLTYDPNGGVGEAYVAGDKEPSSWLSVNKNSFTRDGYEFIGWNTKSDGSGVTYQPGGQYQLSAGADVLYAQWRELTGSFVIRKSFENGVDKLDKLREKFKNVSFTLTSTISNNISYTSEMRTNSEGEKVLEIDSENQKDVFGLFEFKDIPQGTYYLTENNTPDGYQTMVRKEIYVGIKEIEGVKVFGCFEIIDNNPGQIVEDGLEIMNEEIPFAAVLPDTGGPGLGLIKEFGWVLLLLALMMAGMEVQYYGERRRRVRVDEMRMDEQRYEEP